MSRTEWEGGEQISASEPEERRVLFGALDSFYQYAQVAHYNTTHVRRQAFYALSRHHLQILSEPPFSYLDTLNAVDDCIDNNTELALAINQSGLLSFGNGFESQEWRGTATSNDLEKARSTIRQFYRDWSEEGSAERKACNGPVLQALRAERQQRDPSSSPLRVLVPGAGLGRLVFDLCCDGFDTEGNEISYHQLLASSYILNICQSAKRHTVHPWVHSFSNHKTRSNQLRSVLVPDIHPATVLGEVEEPGAMSMTASDFLCLYGNEDRKESFDAVATVFFLDTAPNVIRYLETIKSCLKPGGLLINIGPLQWHFENNRSGQRKSRGMGDDSNEGHSLEGHSHEGHGHSHGEDGAEHSHDSTCSVPQVSTWSTIDQGIADPGSFELTDDEVVALLEKLGFMIEKKEDGIIAPYIHDTESMLQTRYKASHWVARKR
ncbi:N2227-like protein-domain-containing protein [Bisporella sp. PMI_857]|nr:N2227-like protein-domain-containing protein [Bisporella sp. PMI_857]